MAFGKVATAIEAEQDRAQLQEVGEVDTHKLLPDTMDQLLGAIGQATEHVQELRDRLGPLLIAVPAGTQASNEIAFPPDTPPIIRDMLVFINNVRDINALCLDIKRRLPL